MSRGDWNSDYRSLRGLYRDRENGWIFGVCAGLAEFLNFRVGAVRIIVFVCLLVFFWPTVLAYLAAVFLIREKPLIYSGEHTENEFWRRSAYCDRWSHR